MYKKVFITIIILIAVFLGRNFATSNKVYISLPTFDVKLNGEVIDNSYRKYPLITYKDITYFPMTFNDCRFLGIETEWSKYNGLEINKTNVFSEYKENNTVNKNKSSYEAEIPNSKVTINGNVINNSDVLYPLIVFRDVTYFPLTWNYIVDEFDFEYSFNNDLSITSRNEIIELNLLHDRKDILTPIIIDEYYYYVGEIEEKSVVLKTPVNNIADVTVLHTIESSYNPFPLVGFNKMGDNIYFNYRTGGATMGTNHSYRINDNNTITSVIPGFKNYSLDEIIFVNYAVPPSYNNLYYVKDGEQENVGNPDYLYGWSGNINSGASQLSHTNYEVFDDFVYISAIDTSKNSDVSKLYKLNIKTNEIALVSDISLESFYIMDDTIYLTSRSDKLYKLNIGDEKSSELISVAFKSHVILDDKIYYVSRDSNELFVQGSDGSSKKVLSNKKVFSIICINDYLICHLEENEVHKMVIFDSNENIVFKSYDRITSVSLDNNIFTFTVDESMNSYKGELD